MNKFWKIWWGGLISIILLTPIIAFAVALQQNQGGTSTTTVFTTNQIIYQGATSYAAATLGTGLTLNAGVLSASGGISSSSVSTLILPLIANGTVAGVNATSATTSFLIQGSQNLNPFVVASSSGISYLTVLANGNVAIGNGSTTITNLNTGIVQSNSGSLYTVPLNTYQPLLTLPLAINQGGTGTTTPTLIAGTNVTLSGTWPFQTINATGGSGGLGTTTPFTSGQIPEATSTGSGVVLSDSIITQSSTGLIGINSSTPNATLAVKGISGNIYPLYIASSSGISFLNISPSGDINLGYGTSSTPVSNKANSNVAIGFGAFIAKSASTETRQNVVIGNSQVTATSSSAQNFIIGFGNIDAASNATVLGATNNIIGQGSNSIIVGSNNTASGSGATLIGVGQVAEQTDVAIGGSNQIHGLGNQGIGEANLVDSVSIFDTFLNTVIGEQNEMKAGTQNSVIVGNSSITNANIQNSFIFGDNSTAAASNTIILGLGVGTGASALTANVTNSMILGINSTIPTMILTNSGGVNKVGKVGIDTTSPLSILMVESYNSPTATIPFIVQATSSASSTLPVVDFRNGSNTSLFNILTNGKVSIGTTTPAYGFVNVGTAQFASLTTSAASQPADACFDSAGQLINDSFAGCILSSKRFKTNIEPSTLGLDLFLGLHPVTYNYKPQWLGDKINNPNYNGTQEGLIAEDVQKVAPDLITVEVATSTWDNAPPGTPHGLQDFAHWLGPITLAFQQQQKEIQNITIGKITDIQDKWQDILLGLFGIYIIYNEYKRRKP